MKFYWITNTVVLVDPVFKCKVTHQLSILTTKKRKSMKTMGKRKIGVFQHQMK